MRNGIISALFLGLTLGGSMAYAKHAIRYDDLAKVQRIADPQLSPDGKWVAYEAGVVDLAANKTVRHLWMVSVDGGESRQLTRGDGSDTRPRWSPDSKSLAFISTRGGKSQVWILSMDGGDPRQVTTLSTEADGVTWAAHGDTLLFTSQVYPDCTDEECNAKRLKEAEDSKVKAQIFTELALPPLGLVARRSLHAPVLRLGEGRHAARPDSGRLRLTHVLPGSAGWVCNLAGRNRGLLHLEPQQGLGGTVGRGMDHQQRSLHRGARRAESR